MNKRVRSSRSRDVAALLAETPPGAAKPTKARISQLESRSKELDEEIALLECTIAAAPVAMRKRRLATRNTLPALEPTFSRTKRATKSVPQVQRRARRNARMGKLVELLVVFGILAAALGWMNQWFHWWN